MADLFRQTPEYVRIESPSGNVLISVRENGVCLQRTRLGRDKTWKKVRPAGTDTDAIIIELAGKGWKVWPHVLAAAQYRKAQAAPGDATLFEVAAQ
jgi:hypothetical protein